FMQLPYQPYFDYRRTGYPKFSINPKTNMNFNAPDKIPVRWKYPEVEISYNKANLEEALQRQFGGSDEINKLMWILQE
ncbi:MAG TPA: SusD/RagB family nutrient-binding outer membrane lipoprotein, partial [Porphyromonadaceae bacterium]|nr:SusD/RagB family nutrient-binding outer membrane lipoprotein [Porphyromonadaceae bacterium]